MKVAYKIIAIIILQITIIFVSFLAVAYLESQKINAGQIINVAGKNRVLASQVEIETYRLLTGADSGAESLGRELIGSGVTAVPADNTSSIRDALHSLGENIIILRYGGVVADIDVGPIPPQFNQDWENVLNAFREYEVVVMRLAEKENITIQDVEFAEQYSDRLILLSNVLTEKLGLELDAFSTMLVGLQIMFGAINVMIHIAMIIVILRIFDRQSKENIEREKFMVLGEFAAILAHDMKNPLGTIYNSVNLISRNVADDRGRKEVNRINRSISRMTHQIEGVLNYVKTPRIDPKPYALTEILDMGIRNVDVPDNIRLELPMTDAMIRCDIQKMSFVFTNLVMNAVHAIGKEPGRITVAVSRQPGSTAVTVENSGEGIPEDVMEKIFEPLYTTKMHGTGLGLTSCRNIIEAHNGTITVGNNPVTFTLNLPDMRDVE